MPPDPSAPEEEPAPRETGTYGDYLAEREEILRHKWLLSEQAGRDTGFEAALTDWACHHHAAWRRQRAKRGD